MKNNKDQMHPEDLRNLITFAILSIGIWLLYDAFILQPQTKALHDAKKARAEIIEHNPQLLEPVEFLPRDEAIAQGGRVTFDNEAVYGSISLRGGLIDDLSLKGYFETLEKKEHVSLFSPARTRKARFVDYGWVSADKTMALPNAASLWRVQGNRVLSSKNPVTLIWDNGQGLRFERYISLDENYVFSIKQVVRNNSGKDVSLHPYGLISQTDIPDDYRYMWVSHEGPMGFINGALEQMTYGSMSDEPSYVVEASRGWIGVSDKYWLTSLVPQQDTHTKFSFKFTKDPVTSDRDRYQTDFTGQAQLLKDGGSIENNYHLYAGAKKVLMLEKYQSQLNVDNLDLAVDFGWFWFFTYPFFLALHYVGLLVGNMGVAIILLTIVIRMAVFPLTSISYRSFAKMKVVAPQIAEIKKQHGDDKEKLQAEIVELYQREGVNPMSGCLPILVQIPIFFAFYKILLMTIEIRHAPFFGWIEDLSVADPTTVFNLFGLIPWNPPAVLMIGAWPCLMLVAMLLQKRLNPPPQDKMQRDMMNIFPFFITFIMAGFASGLVIYWAFSAFLSMLQQMYIMRSLGVPIYIFEKDKFEEQLEEDLKDGPDVHPLIGMAEEEAEKALFGDQEADMPEPQPIKDITPPKPKKKTQSKRKKKK